MPPELLALTTACSLGFLHALEVDHMIAVTTFVAGRPALGSAARFGFLWGLGHSMALLLLGAVLLVTGVRWPARYDAVGEAVVGAMLVGLGVWAVRTSRKLHVHAPGQHGGHGHLHAHGTSRPGSSPLHAGEHLHAHTLPDTGAHQHHHHHGHGITLVGVLHGLAGTSAVVALLPVTLIGRTDLGLAYLACFGVGVTGGMMVYAVIAALAMRQAAVRSLGWGKRLGGMVGVLGVLVGSWWIIRAFG